MDYLELIKFWLDHKVLHQFFFWIALFEAVLKASVADSQQRLVGLQDIFKTSPRNVFKTSTVLLQYNNFLFSKTSRRRLANMSWRRLEHALEDKKLLHLRRLQDVLKTCFEDVSKTCLEDILKARLKMSSRSLGDKQNVYWGYLYLINLNMYLTNLYFTNLYQTNLKRIQNALIRTQ